MVETMLLPEGCGHMDLARWRLVQGQGWAAHAHNRFHEVLWVEHGSLLHELDGRLEELLPGDIAWIPHGSVHAGRVAGPSGVVFINLSVRTDDVLALRRRFGCDGFPLWSSQRPAVRQLPSDARAGLSRLLTSLDPASATDRDLLLLHLTHVLRSPVEADTDALPAGLRRALADLAAESAWAEGVTGLARRAGRSREHVSRTIRAVLGCAPSALLYTMRMHRIARALVYDERPVAALADEFGFRGLGHFYRGFYRVFGETPAAWRRKRRTGLGLGPVPLHS